MEKTKEKMTRLEVISPDPQSQTGNYLWIITWKVLEKARKLRKESTHFIAGYYVCAAASCVLL